MRDLSARLKEMQGELAEVEEGRERIAVSLPNLPDPDAPDEGSEEDAVVLREVGEPPQFAFEPRDHLDIGTSLGIIDMETAATVSGSRFTYTQGRPGLGRAGPHPLGEPSFLRGARPRAGGLHAPPVLVREEALFGTGMFPGDRDQIYATRKEPALPRRHLGGLIRQRCRPTRSSTPATCRCATPESRPASVGSHGGGCRTRHPRDLPRAPVREGGDVLVRRARAVKVKSTSACSAIPEEILAALEIPYRVVNIPVGDLGAPAAKKYDCEAWIPGQAAPAR